ncbi:MAG: VWA domain-containing protein [Xanthomonadales bacterium]|nr:VWA domain-containing protein [Xanthomonadales bacterium]
MKTKLMVALGSALLVVACAKEVQEAAPEPAYTQRARGAAGGKAEAEQLALDRIEVTGSRIKRADVESSEPGGAVLADAPMSIPAPPPPPPSVAYKAVAPATSRPAPQPIATYEEPQTEIAYDAVTPSPLKMAADEPFSTFSIDVDTGSYSQARLALGQGRLPPAYSVRTEEFLNYFDYHYPLPRHLAQPFAVSTELADAPWNAEDKLLLIGIKGFPIDAAQLPPANLVFLVDTSGSMQSPDKLELLKHGFRRLVEGLRAQDRVAIVAYAGAAGLVLPSTPGNQRGTILAALDRLEAGGGTHGSAGIELAYRTAAQTMIPGGINRVILATDGDFNVGTTSVEQLKSLVAKKRDSGIALTTLGFGAWGYNGEIAEQLADVGNGHHAFIDDELEAQRVLVEQMGATLLTIAKDVKIQVEFDPDVVKSYRLLGYENRALRREDFDNDKVDAGEIGAGHSVTAIYQIETTRTIQPRDDLAMVRIRYKAPQSDVSQLIEHPVRGGALQAWASDRLQFAMAVAGFAEKLRGSPALAGFDYTQVLRLLDASKQQDLDDARDELRDLVELARSLSGQS